MANQKKRKYIQFITNQHTASYCYLRKPDEGREYSDGKYKATLLIEKSDKESLAVIQDACKKAAFAEWGDKPPKGLKSPIKDGSDKADKDPALDDYFIVTLKGSQAPPLVDAAGKDLDDSVNVFSGDQIRVAGAASAYVSGANKGVTLYLNSAQLVKKNTSIDHGAAFGAVAGGFGNEEGEGAAEASNSGAESNAFNF